MPTAAQSADEYEGRRDLDVRPRGAGHFPSRLAPAPSALGPGRAAVFLDRDGVINENDRPVNRADDLRLLPGAAAAIRELNSVGLLVVVVTNQGGIAMGHLTPGDLEEIHARMLALLAAEGARIDRIYYCPYMPDAKVAEFRRASRDRKPDTGMLERARDELAIDLERSYLVGDSETDIIAGNRVGCTTFLVSPHGPPDPRERVGNLVRHLAQDGIRRPDDVAAVLPFIKPFDIVSSLAAAAELIVLLAKRSAE